MSKLEADRPNFPLLEEELLRLWTTRRIVEKGLAQRQGGLDFACAETPLVGWRKPALAEALAWVHTDLFLRYKGLRGYHVQRWNTWQAHGLALEWETAQRLGLSSLRAVPDYGLERFEEACRRAAFRYAQDWTRLSDRLGCARDAESAALTSAEPYIESLWWAFKTLFERGLLTSVTRLAPACPRCGTLLSAQEAEQASRRVEGPAALVRLPLVDDPGASLLAWSEDPWKLPGCVAVAAHPQAEYVIVERSLLEGGAEKLILARASLEQIFGDEPVRIFETFKGEKLKGLRFKPLFTFLLPERPAYTVIMDENAPQASGSGLRPVAPPFSDWEAALAQDYTLPSLEILTAEGNFAAEVRPWSGLPFWEAGERILAHLQERGLLLRADPYPRKVAFCRACAAPLLPVSRLGWYLQSSPAQAAWLISRQRPCGAPLPVWKCPECAEQAVVGSRQELAALAGREVALSRAALDALLLPCPECGTAMARLPDVLDETFAAALAPAARLHVPFENQDAFQRQHPAALFCDTSPAGQDWLAGLQTLSALLFERPPSQETLRLGALPEPPPDLEALFKQHGADALRWALYAAGPGASPQPSLEACAAQAVEQISAPLWQAAAFLAACARRHAWPPQLAKRQADPLDAWLLTSLDALGRDLATALEAYDAPAAARLLHAFVEDLRLWYLPAAQRRLWQNPAGLPALYETIETLCRLLSPLMPYLADLLYQKLVALPGGPRLESVHLAAWPTFDPQRLDEVRLEEMRLVRRLAGLGQAARAQTAFAAYQPLAEMMFWVPDAAQVEVVTRHAGLLAVVLNVQRVGAQARQTAAADLPGEGDGGIPPGLLVYAQGEYAAALNTVSSPELAQAGLAGAFTVRVQALRQEMGLGMGQAIRLHVQASPRLTEALASQRQRLLGDTLAADLRLEFSQAADLATAHFEYGAERATLALEALKED